MSLFKKLSLAEVLIIFATVTAPLLALVWEKYFVVSDGDLIVEQVAGFDMSRYWPEGGGSVNVRGKKESLEDTKIIQFLISNLSKKEISTSDYLKPISIQDDVGEIISIQRCSEKFITGCGFVDPNNISKPTPDWSKAGNLWTMKSIHLKPEDKVCVSLLVKANMNERVVKESFSGAFKNINFKYYSTEKDGSFLKKVSHQLYLIEINGMHIFLTLLPLFVLTLYASLKIVGASTLDKIIYTATVSFLSAFTMTLAISGLLPSSIWWRFSLIIVPLLWYQYLIVNLYFNIKAK